MILKKIIIIFFLIVLINTVIHAKSIGQYTGEILSLAPTGYSAALGGAYAVFTNDINSMFNNPAGMGKIKFKSFLFSHSMLVEDMNMEYIGFAYPIQKSNTSLGIDISLFNSGKIDRYYIVDVNDRATGQKSGTYNNTDKILGVHFGIAFPYDINIGGSVKLLNSKLDNYSSNAGRFTIGIQKYWHIFSDSRLGFSAEAKNMGADMKFNKDDGKAYSSVKIGSGIEFNMEYSYLRTEIDFEFTSDKCLNYYAGVDWLVMRTLNFVAGYNSFNEAGSGLSFGLGTRFHLQDGSKVIGLDYAFVPYGDLGISHRLSLTAKFKPHELTGKLPVKRDSISDELQPAKELKPYNKSREFFDKIVVLIMNGQTDKAYILLKQDIQGKQQLSQQEVELLINMMIENEGSSNK